jgi:hypothetical protein
MKKSRLLEIIREEISEALNVLVTNKKGETTTMPFNTPDEKKSVTNLKADSNITNIETTAGQNIKEEELEEDILNEMAFALKKGIAPSEKIEPRYKKENFKKVVDLILSKVDGTKTMADVARELGVIQQKIRPVVSDLLDAGILEKGEAESKAGKDTANKPGPKSKAEPKEKAEKAPKAKVATRTPGDNGFDKVSYSDVDDEVAAATKAISGDETAKDLGKTSSIADKFANLFNVKTTEEAKEKMKELAKKANSGDQKAKAFFDDEKNKKIIQSYRKAQKVNA